MEWEATPPEETHPGPEPRPPSAPAYDPAHQHLSAGVHDAPLRLEDQLPSVRAAVQAPISHPANPATYSQPSHPGLASHVPHQTHRQLHSDHSALQNPATQPVLPPLHPPALENFVPGLARNQPRRRSPLPSPTNLPSHHTNRQNNPPRLARELASVLSGVRNYDSFPRRLQRPQHTLNSLASRPRSTWSITGVHSPNRQRYKFQSQAKSPSEPLSHLAQSEEVAQKPQLMTPAERAKNSVFKPAATASPSPNSRKRLIEAVDDTSHDERTPLPRAMAESRRVQQPQHSEHVEITPDSPQDISMIDAPPYQGSPPAAHIERTPKAVPEHTDQHQTIPGSWPLSPVRVQRIPIPPNEIYSLDDAPPGTVRDQIALMSGGLVGTPRTSAPGMVVPLSDQGIVIGVDPEYYERVWQHLTPMQKLQRLPSYLVDGYYFPSLNTVRFAVNTVGNRTQRKCRNIVQGVVQMAGSAKRRAVELCDSITPTFISRRFNRQQDSRNLRPLSPNERHRLRARQLGMGTKKPVSPRVSIYTQQDSTPPPQPSLPSSKVIQSYRGTRGETRRRAIKLQQAKKIAAVKGSKVSKKKLDKTASKSRSSRTHAQTVEHAIAMLPPPRRGELRPGAWPTAIPTAEQLRRCYEWCDYLAVPPLVTAEEEPRGATRPTSESEAAVVAQPTIPPASPPSTPPPASLEDEAEAAEEIGAPAEVAGSPGYEGFLTGPSRPTTRSVHWLESDTPMGRPISSVRAYDPLSRVAEPAVPGTEGTVRPETADQGAQDNMPLPISPEISIVKDLPASWEAKVDGAMGLSDKSRLGTTLSGDPLTRKDLATCYTRLAWLNDEVINAYLALIVDYARRVSGNSGRHEKPKYHAFNSFFFSNLRDKGYESVRRWATRAKIGGENLLGVETVFVPVHNSYHWTLMVIRPVARTIEHFDSLGSLSAAHVARAKEWLRGELGSLFVEEEWRVLPSVSPQQNNGSDCGVFLLTTAKLVALEQPLKYGAGDIPEIRKRIVAELMNGGFEGEFDPKNWLGPVRSLL
ncbi:Smt3-specific protease [Onygenales sp. PD_12]|nr:Smt3-specific protease [Onygenales sp. PD_12]